MIDIGDGIGLTRALYICIFFVQAMGYAFPTLFGDSIWFFLWTTDVLRLAGVTTEGGLNITPGIPYSQILLDTLNSTSPPNLSKLGQNCQSLSFR